MNPFMYHVSDPSSRQSIEMHGLHPYFDQTGFNAVYLSTEPIATDQDVWKVYTKGLNLVDDKSTPSFEGEWYMTYDPIPADRLRLMEGHELDEYGDIYQYTSNWNERFKTAVHHFEEKTSKQEPMFCYYKDGKRAKYWIEIKPKQFVGVCKYHFEVMDNYDPSLLSTGRIDDSDLSFEDEGWDYLESWIYQNGEVFAGYKTHPELVYENDISLDKPFLTGTVWKEPSTGAIGIDFHSYELGRDDLRLIPEAIKSLDPQYIDVGNGIQPVSRWKISAEKDSFDIQTFEPGWAANHHAWIFDPEVNKLFIKPNDHHPTLIYKMEPAERQKAAKGVNNPCIYGHIENGNMRWSGTVNEGVLDYLHKTYGTDLYGDRYLGIGSDGKPQWEKPSNWKLADWYEDWEGPEEDHSHLTESEEPHETMIPKFYDGDYVRIDTGEGGSIQGEPHWTGSQWVYHVNVYDQYGPRGLEDWPEMYLKRPERYDIPGEMTIKDMFGITPEGENYYRNAAISDRIDPMTPEDRLNQTLASDEAASTAYNALIQAGGKVYVVGGAVRDSVLGNSPKDTDLMVTGLTGDQVQSVLSAYGRVDLTGKQFGVYRLRRKGADVEIALPRTEQSTGAAHTDFKVQADPNLPIEDDLKRRDFTVNGMAYDPQEKQLIDPYGGQAHAHSKTLSLVNENALAEDPLRIVRALVAQSKHGLIPDQELEDSMTENASHIRHLPGERIQMEMDKLLAGKNPSEAIRTAYRTGVIDHLAPELSAMEGFDQKNPSHDLPVDKHTLKVLEHMTTLSNDPDKRLAALFHDSGKPESFWQDPALAPDGGGHFYEKKNEDGSTTGANHEDVGARLVREFMNRNNYSNARKTRVEHMVQNHMFRYFDTPKGARKFLAMAGDSKTAFDLLDLRESDANGKSIKGMTDYDTHALAKSKELLQKVLDEESAISLKDLAINGKDILDLGVKPGPQISQILNTLLERVIDDPEINTKDKLIEMADSLR